MLWKINIKQYDLLQIIKYACMFIICWGWENVHIKNTLIIKKHRYIHIILELFSWNFSDRLSYVLCICGGIIKNKNKIKKKHLTLQPRNHKTK